MTNYQENFLSMAMTIRDYLKNNYSLISDLPNFDLFFLNLETGISEVQKYVELQEIKKTGIAITKKNLRFDMIQKAMDLNYRIVAYAKFVNNQILMAEVDYSINNLRKSQDSILKEKCQIIYDKGWEFKNELITYGVTNKMFDDLSLLIEKYNEIIPAPRLGIIEKKLATESLANKLKVLQMNIKQIDCLVELLHFSNYEFYKNYHSARKVIRQGSCSLSLKAKIMDSKTNLPVKNVKVVFVYEPKNKSESGFVIEKRSAKLGGFYIAKMAEGVWNVEIVKKGYNPQNLKIVIVKKETFFLEIKLEKVE